MNSILRMPLLAIVSATLLAGCCTLDQRFSAGWYLVGKPGIETTADDNCGEKESPTIVYIAIRNIGHEQEKITRIRVMYANETVYCTLPVKANTPPLDRGGFIFVDAGPTSNFFRNYTLPSTVEITTADCCRYTASLGGMPGKFPDEWKYSHCPSSPKKHQPVRCDIVTPLPPKKSTH